MVCPACSHTETRDTETVGVVSCAACDALYTTHPISLGTSFSVVSSQWHDGADEPEQWRYHDLDVFGSKGRERRHGWHDRRTKRIVQVG